MKKIFEIEKSGGSFIDKENVNSAIRWTIEATVTRAKDKDGNKLPYTRLSATSTISLSDCNRWISWDNYAHDDANGLDTMVKKTSNAIEELCEFRRQLVTIKAVIKKHHIRNKESDDDL